MSLRGSVRAFVALALLFSVLAGCQAEAPEAEDRLWSPPALTGQTEDLPVGREVVQRVVDFMKNHDQVTFQALATYEVVQDDGQKLQFDMLHRVAVHRPDRIFWETLNDDASVETAWFDAGTFTLLKQPANLWGRIKLPPTISDALTRVADEYNIVVPFLDLISGDVAELWLGDEVESVSWVGESWIDGQWTDHVAIRKPEVDLELWFRKGDEPYPAKIVIVRTQEPGLPSYSARFRDWAVVLPDGAIPPFVAPEGSEQVEVVPSSGD
jgi:hypothetical protein